MRIYIANQSEQSIGGGWSFINNFKKGIKQSFDHEFANNYFDCDIFLIPGCTMISREAVEAAKNAGKKIVLRIDNIPRNSRNRNTGTSRLYDFAQVADLIIYQSCWAKNFISQFIDPWNNKLSAIIYNGVDTDIFKPEGNTEMLDGQPQYLYSRYNRDESKMWYQAWYEFQQRFFKDKNSHLWIVGQFSPEVREYNFDFFGGAESRYKYWGVVADKELMASIYRGADSLLVPYLNDACSNTLIEYLQCNGVNGEIITGISGQSGGTPEIIDLFKKGYDFSEKKMSEEYIKVFEELLAG